MISFTQFLMPNGRKRNIQVKRPEDIEDKARQITFAGYKFECEILQTGLVSLTIADPLLEEDVEVEICHNGPEVNHALDKMISRFHEKRIK